MKVAVCSRQAGGYAPTDAGQSAEAVVTLRNEARRCNVMDVVGFGFDDLTRAFGSDTSRGGKGLGLEGVVWTGTAKEQAWSHLSVDGGAECQQLCRVRYVKFSAAR